MTRIFRVHVENSCSYFFAVAIIMMIPILKKIIKNNDRRANNENLKDTYLGTQNRFYYIR